jgi:nitroreductase
MRSNWVVDAGLKYNMDQFIKKKFLRFKDKISLDTITREIETLLTRQSYRRFKDQPLEPGQLELLMAAASSASTSGHLQTWSVIALETLEQRLTLLDLDNPDSINTMVIAGVDPQNLAIVKTPSVFLLWLADLSRADAILQAELDQGTITQEHRDHINGAEYHLKAVIDATIAAQAFADAAESQGLGICYCGAIRQLPIEFLQNTYNLPHYTFPIFGMAVGHPVEEQPSTKFPLMSSRLPLDFVLHKGSYWPVDLKEIEQYNSAIKRSYGAKYTYSDQVKNRMNPTKTKTDTGDSLRTKGFDFK